MTDRKTTDLSAIAYTAVDKDNDLVKIVDVSEAVAADKDKKITPLALLLGSFMGAKVRKAADQTTANYSAGAVIAFDSEDFDVGAWHDSVTNNSRLTVPAGVTTVELFVAVYATLVAASATISCYVRKNGSGILPVYSSGIGTNTSLYLSGCHIDGCVATDYYEIFLTCSDTSITVETETYFAIRAIG